MTREEAKEMFRSNKDAYGKPRHIMKNIDKIYDDFEKEKLALSLPVVMQQREQLLIDALNDIKNPYKYIEKKEKASKNKIGIDAKISMVNDKDIYYEIAEEALKAINNCG